MKFVPAFLLFPALILITVFTRVGASAQAPVTNGLISYWTFDNADVVGNTVKDVWGNSNGIINGTPGKVGGKVGQALEFNGDGDYIEVSSFDRSEDSLGTIEAWLNLDNVDGDYAILQYFVDADNRCKLIYDLKHTKRLRFNLKLAGAWMITADGKDEPVPDKWYHLTIVQDGKTAILYVDGESQAPAEQEGNGEWFSDLGAATLYIGASTTGTKFDHFQGVIDEVRIYSRPLTQAEIRQNLNAKGLAVANSADKLAVAWGEIKVAK